MDHRNLMPPPPQLTPMIAVLEQPKQRGMRFRYECEGRSAGSIPGEHTTQDRKTWPSIQIRNYTGEVTVRVSLVSKDDPPRPHPHSLVGKDCNSGICTVRVSPETQMTATFSNLGIQCVKRKEVADALKLRDSLRVDPFNAYQQKDPQATDIDLNIVKLCFEAFISQGNNELLALPPVVSHAIFDKKATSSSLLRICRVDKSFGSCKGGDEVYLLCDKVQKDDIQIYFYQLNQMGVVIWESFGEFSPTDVHRQVAIVFRTPPYHNPHLSEAIKVLFQLKRSSDGETSESKDFTYLPEHHEQPHMSRGAVAGEKRDLSQMAKNSLHESILKRAKTAAGPNYIDQKPPRPSLDHFSMKFQSVPPPDFMQPSLLQNPTFGASPQFPVHRQQHSMFGQSQPFGGDQSQWRMVQQNPMMQPHQQAASPPSYTPLRNTFSSNATVNQHGGLASPPGIQNVQSITQHPGIMQPMTSPPGGYRMSNTPDTIDVTMSQHVHLTSPLTPQGADLVSSAGNAPLTYESTLPQNNELADIVGMPPSSVAVLDYEQVDSYPSFSGILDAASSIEQLSIKDIEVAPMESIKTEPQPQTMQSGFPVQTTLYQDASESIPSFDLDGY